MSRLPVRTRSGIRLGRVASVDFDVETGKLAAIRVMPGVAARLLSDELLIGWPQIVSITEKEVVVVDTTLPVGATRLASAQET